MNALLMMKMMSVGMTVMHRLSLTTQLVKSGEDEEGEESRDTTWGWVLYDLAWLKVGLVQPLAMLVVAHALGVAILLSARILKAKEVDGKHIASMFGLALVMGLLRMNVIGVEEYTAFVSAVSAVFLLLPVFTSVRHAKRTGTETGATWAWQLVSYAALLATGVRDVDFGAVLYVPLVAGMVGAMVPLLINSIMRPRWVLIGGKLKEKSSFTA